MSQIVIACPSIGPSFSAEETKLDHKNNKALLPNAFEYSECQRKSTGGIQPEKYDNILHPYNVEVQKSCTKVDMFHNIR